jgi:hypothetical protein
LPVRAVNPNELRSCGIGEDVMGTVTVTEKWVPESTMPTVNPVDWKPIGVRTASTVA